MSLFSNIFVYFFERRSKTKKKTHGTKTIQMSLNIVKLSCHFTIHIVYKYNIILIYKSLGFI